MKKTSRSDHNMAKHMVEKMDHSQPSTDIKEAYMIANHSASILFCSVPTRRVYVRLTVFQKAMYFSMQSVRQACSPADMEVPGLGTQASKQCSLTFY